MADWDYALTCKTPVISAGVVADANCAELSDWSAIMRGWRRKLKAIGGMDSGSGNLWTGYDDPLVSFEEACEQYINGLGRRVVEVAGGVITFDGYVARMEFTRYGRTSVRDLSKLTNALNIKYSRMRDNMVTNPGAEAGTANVTRSGEGSVLSQSAEWAASGSYSFKFITGEDFFGTLTWGVTGEIAENGHYEVSAKLNVGAGYPDQWVNVRLIAHPAGDILAEYETPAGFEGLDTIRIDYFSTYTGAVKVAILAENSMTLYVDDVSLRELGASAETGMAIDATSIATFGRQELVLLEGGKSDADAIALRTSELAKLRWPRSQPPESGSVNAEGDGLKIFVLGYGHTLKNKYVVAGGTYDAATFLANLLAECEFVTAGHIDADATSIQIDPVDSIFHYDALLRIMESTGKWGGVGAMGSGRAFDFFAAPTNPLYRICSGNVTYQDRTPANPRLVRPGLVLDEDMLTGPGEITGSILDDPRYFYMTEVEVDDKGNLSWSAQTEW